MKLDVAILLPAYNETFSLQGVLEDLIQIFGESAFYVLLDDSPDSKSSKYALEIFRKYTNLSFEISISKLKTGRGAAIQRGLLLVNKKYPALPILQMDSDGSHLAVDALKVFDLLRKSEFVIGSRYLAKSSITGWPVSRRIFSKLLNLILKKLFRLPINDWTNGLRAYGHSAVEILNKYEMKVSGFTHLTEQILVLNSHGILPTEAPIDFVNRTHGSSSVGMRELSNSFRGILKLKIQKI